MVYLVYLVCLVAPFVWLVWFVLFVSCIEPEKPDKQEKPNEPEEPEKPALSSGDLWLSGMIGFRLVRHRARSGGGGDLPSIKEGGDQHVAHDVHARASPGDDPIHCHDEWNGRDDDLIRQACG